MLTLNQLSGLLIGGIGGSLLLVGLLWWLFARRFASRASTAVGTITRLVPRRSSSSRTTLYAPATSFRTAAGEQIEFVSSHSSNRPSAMPGDTVEVLYLESNPQKARLKRGLYFGAVLLILVGNLLIGIGAIFALLTGS